MNLGFAKKEDTAQIYNIWHICFGDTKKYMEWYFSEVYKSENTLAVHCDGKVVSSLQILPYTLKEGSNSFLCGYVAGVSTLPEYRYRGFSAALMKKADDEMKKRGFYAAFLIPFSFDFYKKYGYEICLPNYYFEGDISKLSEFENNGNFKEYTSPPNKVYNKFTDDFDVFIQRDSVGFNTICEGIKKANGFFCVDKDAYIIYSLKDRIMNISEIAYTSLEGLKNILGFIASKKDKASRFKIINAKKDDLHRYLKDKEVTEKEFPQAMVKLLTEQNRTLIEGTSFLSMPDWI